MRRSASNAWGIFVLFILTAASLCGCSRHPQQQNIPLCRVVTAVTVTYENGPIQMQRHYTKTEKMQQVLNYLRMVDPYGIPAENPEAATGSDFRIVLSYSDGCQKTYRQKGDRYLQEADGQWKRIDPSKAEELSKIIGQLKSDDI